MPSTSAVSASALNGVALDRSLSCRSSAIGELSDLAEFPSLAVRSNSQPFSMPTTSYSPSSPLPQLPSQHLYNMKTDSSSILLSALHQQRAPYANLMRTSGDGSSAAMGGGVNNVEFHIQNEDFPALPGANHLDNHHHGAQPTSSALGTVDVPLAERYTERSSSSALDGPKSGIQTSSDGQVTGIPCGMLNDQFGMAGLLTFLRAIENDPGIVALALGHDLTTLGLNLNATEKNLWATFGGPWADVACRTQDIDTKVPEEYLTNASIRDKLPNIKLNKLSEDVLFYLFYNCPGEVYQVAAAAELYNRDWRFHKGEFVWLTRSQYGGVKEHTGSYEKGTYNVFDPSQWRKIPKELTLEYKQLEERPKLPPQLQSTSSAVANASGTS